MMKKILIISETSEEIINSRVGGIEVYIYNLRKALESDYNIEIISYEELYKKFELKYKKENSCEKVIKLIKCQYTCPYLDNFDLIINSSYGKVPEKYLNKTLFVIHNDLSTSHYQKHNILYYNDEYKSSSKIKKFIFNILEKSLYKKTFLYHPKVVTFNKFHISHGLKRKQTIFGLVPLDNNMSFDYNDFKSKKNECLYIGRLNDEQKNMKLLDEIAKKVSSIINVVGDGPDKFLLDSDNFHFYGWVGQSDFAKLGIKDSKVALFTSNYEGCCISMHEVINLGIIPITTFSSPEVNVLIPKHLKKLLIIKGKNKATKFKKSIEFILSLSENEYNSLRSQINENYKKTYGRSFSDNWKEIVKKEFE